MHATGWEGPVKHGKCHGGTFTPRSRLKLERESAVLLQHWCRFPFHTPSVVIVPLVFTTVFGPMDTGRGAEFLRLPGDGQGRERAAEHDQGDAQLGSSTVSAGLDRSLP